MPKSSENSNPLNNYLKKEAKVLSYIISIVSAISSIALSYFSYQLILYKFGFINFFIIPLYLFTMYAAFYTSNWFDFFAPIYARVRGIGYKKKNNFKNIFTFKFTNIIKFIFVPICIWASLNYMSEVYGIILPLFYTIIAQGLSISVAISWGIMIFTNCLNFVDEIKEEKPKKGDDQFQPESKKDDIALQNKILATISYASSACIFMSTLGILGNSLILGLSISAFIVSNIIIYKHDSKLNENWQKLIKHTKNLDFKNSRKYIFTFVKQLVSSFSFFNFPNIKENWPSFVQSLKELDIKNSLKYMSLMFNNIVLSFLLYFHVLGEGGISGKGVMQDYGNIAFALATVLITGYADFAADYQATVGLSKPGTKDNNDEVYNVSIRSILEWLITGGIAGIITGIIGGFEISEIINGGFICVALFGVAGTLIESQFYKNILQGHDCNGEHDHSIKLFSMLHHIYYKKPHYIIKPADEKLHEKILNAILVSGLIIGSLCFHYLGGYFGLGIGLVSTVSIRLCYSLFNFIFKSNTKSKDVYEMIFGNKDQQLFTLTKNLIPGDLEIFTDEYSNSGGGNKRSGVGTNTESKTTYAGQQLPIPAKKNTPTDEYSNSGRGSKTTDSSIECSEVEKVQCNCCKPANNFGKPLKRFPQWTRVASMNNSMS